MPKFKNIFYKIKKVQKYDNLYYITLYLYNEDYNFKKELNRKINIICKTN